MWLSLMHVVLQTTMKHQGRPEGYRQAVTGREQGRGQGEGYTPGCAAIRPSEPVLRDEDVHIDDIPVRNHAPQHVVHLQLQDRIKWAHDRPHLAHNTHSHAVLIALDNIKGVSKVPFCDVEDDVGLVGWVQRCDSPQKDDLLRTGELSEGGQRDDSVGDGMHWVSHAGLVGGTARLDAADGVCFLLAEGVCGAAIVLGAFKG